VPRAASIEQFHDAGRYCIGYIVDRRARVEIIPCRIEDKYAYA
jgi:hypothetical protein